MKFYISTTSSFSNSPSNFSKSISLSRNPSKLDEDLHLILAILVQFLLTKIKILKFSICKVSNKAQWVARHNDKQQGVTTNNKIWWAIKHDDKQQDTMAHQQGAEAEHRARYKGTKIMKHKEKKL